MTFEKYKLKLNIERTSCGYYVFLKYSMVNVTYKSVKLNGWE